MPYHLKFTSTYNQNFSLDFYVEEILPVKANLLNYHTILFHVIWPLMISWYFCFLTRFFLQKIQLLIWSSTIGCLAAPAVSYAMSYEPFNQAFQILRYSCCWQIWGHYWLFSLLPFRSYGPWLIGNWHFMLFPWYKLRTIQPLLFKFEYIFIADKMEVKFNIEDFHLCHSGVMVLEWLENGTLCFFCAIFWKLFYKCI